MATMIDTSDRCDRCGVQAFWCTWVDLTELHWCNHHFREYETKLRAAAILIVDHTSDLLEKG